VLTIEGRITDLERRRGWRCSLGYLLSVALSAKAKATLVAFARAIAARPPSNDAGPTAIPDVVLHSDQGVYQQNGSQLPFRSGPRSYVLACWAPLLRRRERMVLLDERFRCSGTTLAELLAEGYLAQAPDGRGYVLTALGMERARALT
jgi:hypothetical protein